MLRKLALAAAMLAGLMATGASAHPHHFGPDCGVWWGSDCGGFGDPFYSWREEEFGDRVSCPEAKRIVMGRGYAKVRAASCGVRVHSFTGLRKGHKFLIKVDGYNGDIWSIRRID